ncbi:MAG: amino acid ABC transporter substrate-binding protein [Planctomycetota bacterium]|nr:MAG: amino acid ABC transporter substrate-binding protein [Planctomycetota bacterium]
MTLLLPLLLACGPALAPAQEPPPDPQEPYAETPPELLPYRSTEAYWRFFTEPPQFRGPGRDDPEPVDLEEVAVGVVAPLSGPDEVLGRRFLAGVRMAVAEANAAGGWRRRLPYRLVVREEAQAWGAAASTAVELLDEEGVWGIVGAFADRHSHVLNRVLLKIELPVVNTAGTDPTLTEHAIPWMVRVRPDDRQNGYALARRIFERDGRTRVAVFRSNDRYGRVGIQEFEDAARRLHRPILLEVRFEDGQTAWPEEIARIREVGADAVVVWGRAEPAARVVKALRAGGVSVPLYGPDRLADPTFLAAAGPAAEGMILTHPFDPAAAGEGWRDFARRWRQLSEEEPGPVGAYAYEGTRLLLRAIEEAGLNRPRIRDALFSHPVIDGVMGPIRFDPTFNNVAPVRLVRVVGGRLAPTD